MQDINEEFDRLSKKHKSSTATLTEKLDLLISHIAPSITSSDPITDLQIQNILPAYGRVCGEIMETHKDVFTGVQKFSKNVDKHKLFRADLDQLWDPKGNLLNHFITHSFIYSLIFIDWLVSCGWETKCH